MSPDEPKTPVFFDKKGRRSRNFKYSGLSIAVVLTVLLSVFIVSVLLNPFLPLLRLKSFAVLPQRPDTGLQVPTAPIVSRRDALLKQATEKVKAEKNRRIERRAEKVLSTERLFNAGAPTPSAEPAEHPVSIGFYVNWDDSSFTSLKRNIGSLDWLVPEWIRLSDDVNSPLLLDIDNKALDLIQQEKPAMPILPLLQNYKDEKWNSEILAKWIGTEEARRKLIDSLAVNVNRYKFGGITVDLEEVPASMQKELLMFVEELHSEFQRQNLKVAQAVPFDNPDWDYRDYAAATDFQMLMAYDQHWESGEAGPIAGQDWFEAVLKKRMAELSPAKTVVCFGNYGYKWQSGAQEAEDISFQQAVLTARESLDNPGEIKFDPVSKNPHFSYSEDDGENYDIWFLDAVTAFNQIRAVRQYKVAGLALWRLGSEDPSLWNIFGSQSSNASADDLKQIKYSYDVDFEGTGEILQVIAQPQDGVRDLKIDESGSVAAVAYREIPSSYVIQRTGDQPGKIALTFDDGPDPEWTPKILDILRQENIKAAFFIIGENGQENPALVKRIVDEGH
ncbi:MAG: polysaccharide deacetylase family protein, partial [Acidobacteria bacterium]|nr:polysaccharide deacetylase family protein [Acidobacteriota bacterium]